MIKLLQDCHILIDNGGYGDGSWWEREKFFAGEEIDDEDCKINISDLTEGEDYIRI